MHGEGVASVAEWKAKKHMQKVVNMMANIASEGRVNEQDRGSCEHIVDVEWVWDKKSRCYRASSIRCIKCGKLLYDYHVNVRIR